jgi:hypothetical protein
MCVTLSNLIRGFVQTKVPISVADPDSFGRIRIRIRIRMFGTGSESGSGSRATKIEIFYTFMF